jgi:DHA1 family tetracycline resistance protein-like MFS transporter
MEIYPTSVLEQFNKSPSKRGLPFIFITMFLDIMGSTLLLPILPYIVRQYNLNALTVGLLASTYSAAAFLAAPALGKLSDRLGRRPVLLASVLGSAVGYVLFGVGGALWVLFLSRLIDGFTGGNIATAMAYIADVTQPKERTKYFAFGGIAFGLGFIFGPIIAGVLSGFSIAAPAFAAGALSFASFLFGLIFLPESLPPERRIKETLHLSQVNPFSIITEIGRLPNLTLLLTAIFLIYLAYSGLFSYITVYTLEHFSATPQNNSYLFLVVGVFQMLGQGVIVYRLTPHFGEKQTAVSGLILQAVAYPLFVFAPTFLFLYPLAMLSALGNAFTRPTLDALVANNVPPQEQGRAQGTTSGLYSLTNILGPLLAGFAFVYISPESIFVGGGLLLALAGIIVWRVKDVQREVS